MGVGRWSFAVLTSNWEVVSIGLRWYWEGCSGGAFDVAVSGSGAALRWAAVTG